ncbi:MAG: PD-(D/E)XK nuclease family protein [Pirellulaceae bacterium]|jgi:RecB family exonuclease|nr:PD-(D/E)XK nuclease family protein [Pirellulaceae bacterium]MDP6554866.1 PD-(D/E)XK nuclease family protein [Pirellulaceae bacterium]
MPIHCEFLGFDRAALDLAADYLLRRYRTAAIWDLQQVIVVTPAARAGRRLLEILVQRAAQDRLLLTPPTIETVGRLPEQLYPPKRPFANELTQRFTWSSALQSAAQETVLPVIPNPPACDEVMAWAELADMLRQLHVELAGDGLAFADVAERLAETPGHPDQQRWSSLEKLQSAYLRRLDDLQLWDRQTARLEAIKRNECDTDRDIVLVGTVDMNLAVRQMLDQVAQHVVALVAAPQAWRERFDSHGCLAPDKWNDIDVPLDAAQVRVCDGPADQANAVAAAIASYKGRYRADEIAVGFPDEQLVPDVERVLARHGVPSRWGPGRSLRETAPYLLLEALADFLDRGRFQELASLVRHPDMQFWLRGRGINANALAELDDYYNQHLPGRLVGQWLGPALKHEQMSAIEQAVSEMTRDLAGQPRGLAQWCQSILNCLAMVYANRELDRENDADQSTLTTCRHIRNTLLEMESIPSKLNVRLSACDSIRLLLGLVATQPVPRVMGASAVELLGWLELPLDDAPALVVTTLNERFVPSSVTSDLFLPNALRNRLGLIDNARRYARDAYALCLLLGTRTSLHLLVGRRNRDGDPLIPSRLLFTGDDQSVAQRAMTFFAPLTTSRHNSPAIARAASSSDMAPSTLEIPRPQPLTEPLKRLTITSFRDYLSCPYRFYLKHVLRLRSSDDAARELSPLAFGNLAHEALRRFGEGASRESSDVDEIRRALNHELDVLVRTTYGQHVLPFVRVQIEQLRFRLNAFAQHQADWFAAGWRIEHTEVPDANQDPATFDVDGEIIGLTGRMDRIDVHHETGQRVIFDYKTSDTGNSPEKTHQQGGRWTDLQLPLYRHLATAIGISEPVQLGFVTLPKDTTQVAFILAKWTTADLEAADATAREVVRQIRQEIFWPPVDPPPRFSEEFATICQDGVFGKRVSSTA